MTISTPKRRATLIALANLALVAIVPALAAHLAHARLAGAFTQESDSVRLAITGVAGMVAIAIVPLNVLWWLLCRNYPGRVSLWASARALPVEYRVVSQFGLAVAALLLMAGAWDLIARAAGCTPVYLLGLYSVLAFRAAFIQSAEVQSRHAGRQSPGLCMPGWPVHAPMARAGKHHWFSQ